VTAAASVLFFRPEFDDFLYAPIGADDGEMSLSVLSALSRLNFDPWEEAAELSELPADTAIQRLALLIARLPGGRWAAADSHTIAGRLIKLLPSRSSSRSPAGQVVEKAHGLRALTGSTFATIVLCIALGVAALIVAIRREPSSQDDRAISRSICLQRAPGSGAELARRGTRQTTKGIRRRGDIHRRNGLHRDSGHRWNKRSGWRSMPVVATLQPAMH
jgi:hypothetical protein